MTAGPGLRERKRRRTKDLIVDEALRLFASRGFDRVTMADIADAAEVGSRTVFRYFGDKAEIVFADDDLVDDQLRAALLARPRDEHPWPAVTEALTALTTLWADRREEGRRRRALIDQSPPLTARHLVKLQHHAEVIARELVDRGTPPQVASVVARGSVAAFDCAVDAWLDDAEGVSLETWVRRALAVLTMSSWTRG